MRYGNAVRGKRMRWRDIGIILFFAHLIDRHSLACGKIRRLTRGSIFQGA